MYDHGVLEKWTNAAHLIRKDTGKLLRESDLAEGGSRENFVAWDDAANEAAVWDADQVEYKRPDI
ncbi:MAG: hypothetical protein GWN58_64595, partial [Anaerolineae bacterium]|nr:hypothetical protein [Anaerolineae bacterium]